MTLIEKEQGKSYLEVENANDKKEYASKGVAGTALGLGIAGTALWLLGGGLNGTGLFGRGLGVATPAGVGLAAGEVMNNRDIQYVERKQCSDFVELVNGMWEKAYAAQANRFSDARENDAAHFGLYKSMRDGFDIINAKSNENSFNLYKYSRDSKDEVMGEIGALKTEIAVLKAIRPYQDALIKCDIDNVAKDSAYNLAMRTCRMIQGEVVLPSTPTVTGFPSSTCCTRTQAAATPTA